MAYHYDPEQARFFLERFQSENVKEFLNDFTSSSSHQIGTSESYSFAVNISHVWTDFGIPKVEISHVKNKIPKPDVKMPSKITIFHENGTSVFSLEILNENDLVSFTPGGVADGQLIYGHYGRFQDLTTLQRYCAIKELDIKKMSNHIYEEFRIFHIFLDKEHV